MLFVVEFKADMNYEIVDDNTFNKNGNYSVWALKIINKAKNKEKTYNFET